MDRWILDLGTARNEEVFPIYELEYIYVGDCDGDVTIKIGSRSASPLNPLEFNKLIDIKPESWLYITNTAQAGKQLVLYIKERKRLWL